MTELFSNNLIESSISSSRNIQELFSVANENTTSYGVLASLIVDNISFFDALAESVGAEMAKSSVRKEYDKQFFNPKYGNVKNFFTRNIYLNPNKRVVLQEKRMEKSIVTQGIVEYGIKIGVRGIQKWSSEIEKVKTFEDIYNFLDSFSVYGDGIINKQRSRIELSKIVKSFPISLNQRKRIQAVSKGDRSLQEIVDNTKFLSKDSNKFKENVAYLLFAIHAQKYQNYEEEYIDDLLEYYNILGYHESYAKELIRENRMRYTEIIDDQVQYLKLARVFINKMVVSVPEIDLDRIKIRAEQMAAYDPYSIRRKNVQNAVGTGGVMLAAFFAKRPDVVIHAGSTALSQVKLENNDNAVEYLEKKFYDNGIDSNVFRTILDGRKTIISDAILSE